MENNIVKPRGGFFKQSFLVLLFIVSVYLDRGLMGLAPFINFEAILLVFGGTFLLTWTAFPLSEMFSPTGPRALRHAAGCAIGLGVLYVMLTMIPVLWVGEAAAVLTKRFSLALAGLFYGLLLSKVILTPLAARLES
ncbi:MAG: hypothetical protein Q7R35_19440 [Elusimicrobiota bacterium]|nr:hypothetical protein [Elusimicrobiota bacterium]